MAGILLGTVLQGGYNEGMFRQRDELDEEGYFRCHLKTHMIAAGQLRKVKVAGHSIVVTRVNDQIVAFGESCPHGAASLAKGTAAGRKICCPEHGYCFDMQSGALLWPEDEPYRLHRFRAKIVDDEIWLLPTGGKQV